MASIWHSHHVQVVGSGSFGVVFSATIAETGEAVAVKKVCRKFPIIRVLYDFHLVLGFAGQAIQKPRVAGGYLSRCGHRLLRTNACLQIMKSLRHQNVVHLKHCFFSNNEKDELCVFYWNCAQCLLLTATCRYLNLVMEYVPETIYRVVKHYNKTKRPIPMLYIKLYMYQGTRHSPNPLYNIHLC